MRGVRFWGSDSELSTSPLTQLVEFLRRLLVHSSRNVPMTPLTDSVFSLEFPERMLSCLEPTLGMEKRRGLIPEIAAANVKAMLVD